MSWGGLAAARISCSAGRCTPWPAARGMWWRTTRPGRAGSQQDGCGGQAVDSKSPQTRTTLASSSAWARRAAPPRCRAARWPGRTGRAGSKARACSGSTTPRRTRASAAGDGRPPPGAGPRAASIGCGSSHSATMAISPWPIRGNLFDRSRWIVRAGPCRLRRRPQLGNVASGNDGRRASGRCKSGNALVVGLGHSPSGRVAISSMSAARRGRARSGRRHVEPLRRSG